MSKKLIKQMIRNIYMLLSLVMAFCSAIWLWYWNVGVGWDKGYFGGRTLVTVGAYFLFLCLLTASCE